MPDVNLPLTQHSHWQAQKALLSTQARQAVFESFPEKIMCELIAASSLMLEHTLIAPPPHSHLGQLIQSFAEPSHPLHASNINPDMTIFCLPPSVPTEPAARSPPAGKTALNGAAKEGTANGAPAEGDEEDDEKSLRTGLRTNAVFRTMGDMLQKEGESTLEICVGRVAGWRAWTR